MVGGTKFLVVHAVISGNSECDQTWAYCDRLPGWGGQVMRSNSRSTKSPRQRLCSSPVSVDDGIEGESVPPGLGEVLNVDAGVLVGGLLGPSQQRLLGREVLLANNNVRDLEEKKKTISSSDKLKGFKCMDKVG